MPSLKLKSKPKPKIASELTTQFDAIGTRWNITSWDAVSSVDFSTAIKQIKTRINQFDKHYSRFRADSLVSKMAERAGSYKLPADARPMLDVYQKLYVISEGAVTPLIGQTMSDAGYDASYSLQPRTLRRPPSWHEALDYSFPTLELKQPALLDFGAAGKGYLIDIVAEMLGDAGLENFFINAGGDIVQRSATHEPFSVGLEHPADTAQAIGIAKITNQSICASAGNRRKWDKYTHIIDPQTLESPKHVRATWVVADSALLADGLATALFFVEPDRLRSAFEYECAIVYEDFSLEFSTNFPAEFFSAESA